MQAGLVQPLNLSGRRNQGVGLMTKLFLPRGTFNFSYVHILKERPTLSEVMAKLFLPRGKLNFSYVPILKKRHTLTTALANFKRTFGESI